MADELRIVLIWIALACHTPQMLAYIVNRRAPQRASELGTGCCGREFRKATKVSTATAICERLMGVRAGAVRLVKNKHK